MQSAASAFQSLLEIQIFHIPPVNSYKVLIGTCTMYLQCKRSFQYILALYAVRERGKCPF